MEKKHLFLGILILVILITGVFIYMDLGAATIEVNGQGFIEEMPDIVSVYLNIEQKADDAKTAKDRVSEISENVISSLYLAGIDKEKITTQSFSVYPNYEWGGGERKQKGFVARQTLKVESENFDDAGKIVDISVDNGAFVNYINFELSEKKQEELKTEVMKKASEDARAKAEGIAEGLNKNLGKLVSIQTSDFYYPPYRLYDSKAVGSSVEQSVTEINPDKIEVRARITAKFKIY